MNLNINDEVPDLVIVKISNILEPFLNDINPQKVLSMIEDRNTSKDAELGSKWLTPEAAAKALECTRQTIYNMVKSNRLTHRYLGNGPKAQLRILLEDIYQSEVKEK